MCLKNNKRTLDGSLEITSEDSSLGNSPPAKRKATHNDLERKRRDRIGKAVEDLQRALPQRLFWGLTKVSQCTVLDETTNYIIETTQKNKLMKQKIAEMDAKNNFIRKSTTKIKNLLAKGKKEEARVFYEKVKDLVENDDDDDTSDESSDDDDTDDDDTSDESSDDDDTDDDYEPVVIKDEMSGSDEDSDY